jgi:hypothetical protein
MSDDLPTMFGDNSVLVVVDVQNNFCPGGSRPRSSGLEARRGIGVPASVSVKSYSGMALSWFLFGTAGRTAH